MSVKTAAVVVRVVYTSDCVSQTFLDGDSIVTDRVRGLTPVQTVKTHRNCTVVY